MTHYGFDERLDEYLHAIWGFFVQWSLWTSLAKGFAFCRAPLVKGSLIFWHWTTETWDTGHKWVRRTLHSVKEAHKEDVWVFIDRNSTPLLLKEDKVSDHYTNCLLFYPKTNIFFLHNRLVENRIESFDCVDVRLGSQENVTGFFMNLRWKQSTAPTLYECVLLYSILKGEPLSKQEITSKCLVVLDSDASEHTILLGSELAKRRFTSWV